MAFVTGLAHRRLDVAELVERRVELGRKGRDRAAGKALVRAAAEKLQFYVVAALFHILPPYCIVTRRGTPAASKTFRACAGTPVTIRLPPKRRHAAVCAQHHGDPGGIHEGHSRKVHRQRQRQRRVERVVDLLHRAVRAVVIQLSADRKRHLSSVCSCQNLHVPTSSCSFCTSVRFQYSLSAAVFLSKECAIPFLFACSVFFSLALFPSDIVKCCYHIKGRTA